MADQGDIGIGRPLHSVRLTDYQATPSGETRDALPGQGLAIALYSPTWNGSQPLGLPRIQPRALVAEVTYPESYWHFPCVMGDRRGQIYWTAGSNGLFNPQEHTETPAAATGWRWYRPGTQRMRWAVAPGLNTLTLVVAKTSDAEPRPTLRVLANAAIDVPELAATVPAGISAGQPITLSFVAGGAGIVTVQLEHWNFAAFAQVVWENFTLDTP